MSFTYSGLPKRAIEIAEVCSLCFVAGFGLDKQTASIYISLTVKDSEENRKRKKLREIFRGDQLVT